MPPRLNHGERVAQAPIEQLLAGSGGPSYDVTVRGDTDAARSRLAAQPWVDRVEVIPLDGVVNLRVLVADERCAERELLRVVLADEKVEVARFTPTASELEDVFVQLVEARPS